MRNLFYTIAGISVLSIGATPFITNDLTTVTMAGQKQKVSENWVGDNVRVRHNIHTKATGADFEHSEDYDCTATLNNGDNFLAYSRIIANGYFKLAPYLNPIYSNHVQFDINTEASSSQMREGDFDATNDQGSGGAHQISYVALKVVARYQPSSKITVLSLSSYISARTAGSVHECYTLSQVDSMNFIA